MAASRKPTASTGEPNESAPQTRRTTDHIAAAENQVNRALTAMQRLETRWKHLPDKVKESMLAELRQAVARVEDSNNRKRGYTAPRD